MTYYESRFAYRYVSKLEASRGFDSADEARAFDLKLARATCTRKRLDAALERGDRALAQALRLLADEILAVPEPLAATELL